MNYPYEKTGNRILKLRKDRGMTREKLAELADISVQFLADIEKGRKNMTVTTLRKLSSALLVSTDYIVNGSEDAGLNTELLLLCKSLSPEMQHHVVKLINVFIDATS